MWKLDQDVTPHPPPTRKVPERQRFHKSERPEHPSALPKDHCFTPNITFFSFSSINLHTNDIDHYLCHTCVLFPNLFILPRVKKNTFVFLAQYEQYHKCIIPVIKGYDLTFQWNMSNGLLIPRFKAHCPLIITFFVSRVFCI